MRREIGLAFKNPLWWIASVTMLLCFLGFSLPTWIDRVAQGDRMLMDAFSQGFAPIFFGGAILLFPFCAAIPYATSQVEEIRTGFIYTKAIRCSVKKYASMKIIAVVLSAAAAMAVASLVHSLLWNIVAGAYNPSMRPDTEVVFGEGTVYDTLKDYPYAWPAFLHAALGFAISGAVWAMIALATAVWIPDTLLTVTVPVVIYYFWTYGLLRKIFGAGFPTPSALYNDGQYWWMYGRALIVNASILVIAIGIYYRGLKRRLRFE